MTGGGYHVNIEERREVTCYLHGLEGGGGEPIEF